MGNVKIWLNVPDGSTFKASATGTTDNWEALVDIDSDTGEETQWTSAELEGGASMVVHSPHTYTVRVDVEAPEDSPAAVTFTAKLVDPMGNPYDSPFTMTTPAQKGTYVATLGIVTE